jgi:hypothetical protein
MGEISMSVPRLRCIAGRWFWRPSASLRAKGYKNIALGTGCAPSHHESQGAQRESDARDQRYAGAAVHAGQRR